MKLKKQNIYLKHRLCKDLNTDLCKAQFQIIQCILWPEGPLRCLSRKSNSEIHVSASIDENTNTFRTCYVLPTENFYLPLIWIVSFTFYILKSKYCFELTYIPLTKCSWWAKAFQCWWPEQKTCDNSTSVSTIEFR